MVAAANPARYGQRVELLSSTGAPAEVAKAIAAYIDSMLVDPQTQAAAIVMPDLTTLEKTAEVFLALASEPKWNVQRSLVQIDAANSVVAFNISREIPFGAGTCPSEGLVLGPFEDFPATRRAPVTAFEMFVGEPLANDPGSGKPSIKAHLAHMRMEFPTAKTFDVLWQATIKGRLASLGNVNDVRAKAKISFVIPANLAKAIGCMP
ncbi:MAG: hypothetical protein JSR91_13800 [Proteobacteria bacterium]|nr:hypothetical protein [Pseudomonadota bacterium]